MSETGTPYGISGKPKRNGRKLPTTPRSRVKNALRMLWLRSRERAACIKAARNTCAACGAKGGAAKGREVKTCVHHLRGCDWDGVVDAVIRAVLHDPKDLQCLCETCHKREHKEGGQQ